MSKMAAIVNSEKVTIRIATKKDIPTVDALWKESAQYHSELDTRLAMQFDNTQHITEFHTKQLEKEDTLFLVATTIKVVVGFLIAHIVTLQPHHTLNRLGVIDGMAVTHSFRGQGIGSLLFDKTLEWFEAHKVERIDTSVAAKNPRAQTFWKRKGFTPRIYHITFDMTA